MSRGFPPPCAACDGACCKQTHHEFAVILDDEEAGGFPEAVEAADGMGGKNWWLPYEDGRCIFLGGDDRCTIYPRRPRACQTFNCVSGWGIRNYNGIRGSSCFLEDNPRVNDLIEKTYGREELLNRLRRDANPDVR